ncbi:EF hand domain-containing protein, partial [Toxoplasma gondii ARI]
VSTPHPSGRGPSRVYAVLLQLLS